MNPTAALRRLLYLVIALAAFLALGWPYAVSNDAADSPFRVVALATLAALFVLLVACCAMRLRRRRAS